MAKRKPKPVVDGITFDSQDEVEFYWWCREALDHGVLECFQCQFPTFILAEPLKTYEERFGKSGKPIAPRVTTILREVTYTADFQLEFAPGTDPVEFGFQTVGTGKILVDVKPGYEPNDARQRKFSVLQKWVWKDHGRFVQPIVPVEIFGKSWCPALALLTPGGKARKSERYRELMTICKRLDSSD